MYDTFNGIMDRKKKPHFTVGDALFSTVGALLRIIFLLLTY